MLLGLGGGMAMGPLPLRLGICASAGEVGQARQHLATVVGVLELAYHFARQRGPVSEQVMCPLARELVCQLQNHHHSCQALLRLDDRTCSVSAVCCQKQRAEGGADRRGLREAAGGRRAGMNGGGHGRRQRCEGRGLWEAAVRKALGHGRSSRE